MIDISIINLQLPIFIYIPLFKSVSIKKFIRKHENFFPKVIKKLIKTMILPKYSRIVTSDTFYFYKIDKIIKFIFSHDCCKW